MNKARKIKLLRELNNFTQEHLAQELAMSQSTYSKKENGSIKFEEIECIRAAKIFNVCESFILDDKNALSLFPESIVAQFRLEISELEIKLRSLQGVNQMQQKIINQLTSYLEDIKNLGGGIEFTLLLN
jgi:transcriptional regulator with XRE-family HTH domain